MSIEILKQQLEYTGCRLYLDGDNIRYRFTGKQIPDDAKPLLQELKTHKSEMVALLKPTIAVAFPNVEQSPMMPTETAANVKTSWSPEIQSLIDWFMAAEPPPAPFDLEPHRHVIDPEKFFASLRQEITIGPSCPRNRNGALLCDLEILRKYLH